MAEKLGRVVRSQWEDIWLQLDRGGEEPQLELRLHNHNRSGRSEEGAPGGERISLPVRLLPELLQLLTLAQDRLRELGLLERPEPAGRGQDPSRRQDARQFPRVTVDPAMECRVVDPEGRESAQTITGQIKDVSKGGAQAWLPLRFPQLKQIEVFMTIEGIDFRGRAEIVGIDEAGKAEPQGGLYRHNLRWVTLHAHGMNALSKIVPGG